MASSSSRDEPCTPLDTPITPADPNVPLTPASPAGVSVTALQTPQQPSLSRSSSYDTKVLRDFSRNYSAGNFAECAKLLAADVEWVGHDGKIRRGHQECIQLFQDQHSSGVKRKPTSDWLVLPPWQVQEGGIQLGDEDDDRSFYARRSVHVERPGSQSGSMALIQTVTVLHGLIKRMVVQAASAHGGSSAAAEGSQEAMATLGSFACLRLSGNLDGAAMLLTESCQWRRIVNDAVFRPSQLTQAEILHGREAVKQLWAEQFEQGLRRKPLSEWYREQGSDSTYWRRLSISNNANQEMVVIQTAHLEGSLIAEILHQAERE